ncbi:DUF421 domain-containing protein [Pedobacter terrae]|uniref:DUF421 domain-containing protein n=1 Tax=Pedobacter terrae TaxID=405671 RepID=UPI002FF4E43B
MMKEYEIKLNDLRRILIGEIPLTFYAEVILRTAVIYLILMISMRLMGKRMSSQLSRNEMAAVASLAAAVGVPLMNPDRGLLPAVVIAIVLIGFQLLIAKIASKNKKFESITQDKYNMIVKDGVLNIKAMLLTRVSRDRALAQLRKEGITHLGSVKRLYFEAGGTFSLLKTAKPLPGLSIIPAWDDEFSDEIHRRDTAVLLCSNCGNSKPDATVVNCQNCGENNWIPAVNNLNDLKK